MRRPLLVAPSILSADLRAANANQTSAIEDLRQEIEALKAAH